VISAVLFTVLAGFDSIFGEIHGTSEGSPVSASSVSLLDCSLPWCGCLSSTDGPRETLERLRRMVAADFRPNPDCVVVDGGGG
jgi:hypothetical protein